MVRDKYVYLYQARDCQFRRLYRAYSDIFYTEDSIIPLLNTSRYLITYDPNWLDQWSKRFADPFEERN